MQATNIEQLASQYPHLAAAFATIPQGEAFTLYCLTKGAMQRAPTLPPYARLRIAAQREAMDQIERGNRGEEHSSALPCKSIGYRLGGLWPRG